MPSFNGRKSGEGDPQLIAKAMPFAEQQAYIHATLVQQQKLAFGQRTIPIPGGGYVVSSISATGMPHIHVVVGTLSEQATQYRPLDYYSGLVFGGNLTVKSDLQALLEYGEGTDEPPKVVAKMFSFYPEPETVAKFPPHELTEAEQLLQEKDRTYYDGFSTPYAPVQVTKLAVRVYNGLEDMSDTAPIKYTGSASTYSHIRPTMFTGSMRKVVQFVMGVGKVLQKSWYPSVPAPDGTLMTPFFRDRDEYNAASEEADGVVQLRYDFRYGNCYNVYQEIVGDKVKWWLVRVSQALGIIAMPLPLDAVSVLPAFRTAMDDMLAGDPPAPVKSDIKVLDTFGGFPTGATFEPQVEAYIRAGQYVRLASTDDLDDYLETTVWGDQIGWSFSYDGKLAKCVAYADIELGGNNMCRALRDMTITFDLTTDSEFETGAMAQRLKGALGPLLPSGDDAKGWHLPKIGRLSESDAESLLTMIEQAEGDQNRIDALLNTFEFMQATPIGAGSAKLAVGQRWAFNPPYQLFKTAHLPFDMCPSVTLPADAVLKEYGDYRSPGEGEQVPLYRWFTEDGRDMAIWFDGGATGTYQTHTSESNRTTHEYQSRAASCFVAEQPITMEAKDIYPNTYTEYKSGGQHHAQRWASAANDVTPEGFVRADWLLRKYVTSRNDGGPDKADLEFGSAYMVFGDAEAALEFNYHHHPAIPPWTITYDRTTVGNMYSYDWNYEYLKDANGNNIIVGGYPVFVRYVVDCWQTNPEYAAGQYPVYCSRPAPDLVGIVPDEWRKPFDYPVGKFVVGVIDGHWAKKGDTCWGGGVAPPEIPANENFAGTSAWSKRTTRVYSGAEVVSTFEDNTYVTRTQAFFDILELQKSVYDPPPESPYVEHDVRGTRNCFGKESGGYMKAVNDYTYTLVGTELHSNQLGDMPCFVGVILDL